MQKWEYLRLYINPKYYGINGVEIKWKPNENMFMLINRLGEEGWELVSQPTIDVFTF